MTGLRKISMREAIGFGAGDFYGGGQLTLIATYLALFWTRFGGMSIATAQGIIGVSALVSAVGALVFGVLDDNLYRYPIGRRFGRRGLMLMLIAPSLLIGVLLWTPGLPVAAYAAVYVLWVLLAQAFQASYNPLPGEMTQDFGQRTKLSTVRLVISTSAGTLIPLVGGWALAVFGEDRPTGYMVFAIGATVVFALAVGVTWRTTWEMTPEQAGFGAWASGALREPRLGVRGWARRAGRVLREYASTLRIKEFRKHLSIYLLVQVSMDVSGQTFVFFVIYDWNRTAAFASLLLGCAAVSLPLMPLFGWLMTRIGPRRLYAIDFAGMLVGLVWLGAAWIWAAVDTGAGADAAVGAGAAGATGSAASSAAWTVFAVAGSLWFFAFKSLCGYLPWAVFPFIADVDQIVTKRYRSATFSGIQAGFRQLGSGIATICVGLVLGAVGFDSTRDAQPTAARIGLAAVMLGWMAFAMIVCWVVSQHLNINRATDMAVLREIDRLRNGGRKSDATPEARATVERLTGVPYRDCWPEG